MIIEPKQRVVFLNRIHLFGGIREDGLERISARMQEKVLPANAIVFKKNDKPDGFYLIYKGKVKITRPNEEGNDELLAWLSPYDYFGEEALIENRNRSATVTTTEETVLLFLSREWFNELIQEHEKLLPNFKVTISSHKIARAERFQWLGEQEVIYFLARRHKIRLYVALLVPILTLFIPIALLAWGLLSGATTPTAVGIVALLANIGWIIWQAVDWSNDYYIVTNQRVIWLEKVIGVYDSRQEVPISSILSVGVETDFLGRQLGYGTVVVRTFVGVIRFEYVDYPDQAADMVREYWERTKGRGVQAQKDAMKNAIRSKLGLPVIKQQEEKMAPVFNAGAGAVIPQRSLFWTAFSNMFKLRQEDGETVTYHKHWFVLIQQAWRPLIAFFFLNALVIVRAYSLYRDPANAFFEPVETGGYRPDTFIITLLFFIFVSILWLAYEYWDWTNDIFMVTPEEIMDLDKKPFGTEERRTAQVESILSIEYKRIGLLGNIFNYGTVYITVGGSKLSFQDVLDPAGVQADINRRRAVKIAKKAEDAAVADRERMATWVASYHQNREEFIAASADLQAGNTSGNIPITDKELDTLLDDYEADEGFSSDGGAEG